jgi:hypothetical protein
MKKLILSVTALSACSLGAYAQGVIQFNSSSGSGVVEINGVVDKTQDINAELLFSSSASGTFAPVAQMLLSSSNTSGDGNPGFDPSDIITGVNDIVYKGNGALFDTHGNAFVPSTAAAGTTLYFEVEGWLGNSSSYPGAGQGAGSGITAVFSDVTSIGTSPIIASLVNMPDLNLTVIPEPSTLAMAGVGAVSMLLMRRRNK